jgi:translation initiation factor eIF-2B subunit delta
VGEDVERLIAAIRDDRLRGAASLTRAAAEVLIAAASWPLAPVARRLVEAQPAMAPIWNLTRAALAAESSGPDAVAAACRDFVARLDLATSTIARRACSLVLEGGVVLTHSSSEAVFETLLAARRIGRGFQVIVTESRPLCEGAGLARRLEASGISAGVVIDAAMARAFDAADVAITGADSVNATHVVNKVGTRLLALAARHAGKPAYVLCPSMKFWDREAPAHELFEATPRSLFHAIVTEEGEHHG